ncbi:MAG: ATP-binding protein [Puniceicoccaceae bacterium]
MGSGVVAASLPLAGRELTRVWQSEALMDKPESALFCADSERVFVSNISGDYFALDGTGFISTVALDGSILQLHWFFGGLNNPQGLALHEGLLYVADLTRVICINTQDGSLERIIAIEGSEFINDLSADANGDIYASDCKRNRIYRIREGVPTLWLEADAMNGINGILCEESRLLFINFTDGRLYAVNKATQEISMLCEGIANGDGITSDGAQGYFVSGAWQGEVFHINASGQKQLVLDLGTEGHIAADLTYLSESQLLLIPTLYQSLLAYRWQ